jgi:hypothetical protein
MLRRRCLSHPSWERLKSELILLRQCNGGRRTDPVGEDVPGADIVGCVGGTGAGVAADGDGSFIWRGGLEIGGGVPVPGYLRLASPASALRSSSKRSGSL